MTLRFSIVTCTWNSEPWLAESIASVLAQDHPAIEYVFVDGGSTDGTLERIRSIPRPVTVVENVRGGISRAMNEGIRAATGDVIAHLHSDDYYADPTVLSRVDSAFESSGKAWCVGRIAVRRGATIEPEAARQPAYSHGRLVAGSFFVPHPATFVRRDALDTTGYFDETLKYAMDIDLWLRLGARFDPVTVNDALAVFRDHAGSLSSANRQLARDEEAVVRSRRFWRHPAATTIALARYWVRRRRARTVAR
jgi:glycosyltransferase involved in cell wall biosynthesis